MAYLLAQYALLFLLTALVSFLLGRWWVQRRYIDITESWESLRSSREADEGFRDRLWTGLEELRRSVAPTVRTELAALPQPELPEPNLDRILMELKRLETRIDGIKPTPAADLKPIHSRLDTLDARLSSLKLPSDIDLTPVLQRLDSLEQRLEAKAMPAAIDLAPLEQRIAALPIPQQVDLTSLEARLDTLAATFRDRADDDGADKLAELRTGLDAIHGRLAAATQPAFDPQVLNDRLDNISRTLSSLPRLERQDLQSIHFRLGAVEQLLREAAAPAHGGNRAPGENAALERLATLLVAQGEQRLADPPSPPAAAPEPLPEPMSAPELLDTPNRGAQDDLKRISGIGPKLEQLLNDNGVFYFQQIARWNDAEVRFMDDRLEIFPGRIQRDRWVAQAQALAAETDASGSDLFSES